ncbi:MAG: aldo/keto reductase [Myxococcales bacterium]|nr:aldo/keto reductase [Myxococcales bacterium]
MSQTQQIQERIALGQSGPAVAPFALGCMGMSGAYSPARRDEGIATIHAALERGVCLLDTGDFYGMGHNELLVREAIAGRREQALLSVKFGAMRTPSGGWSGVDTRPAAVKNFCAYSLQRLGVDTIDIYRPARLDPNVPIEDTVGAIADLIKAGHVRYLGLSEVGPETIRRAHAVHPVVDVQLEYSLVSRGPERAIFPLLRELGISATLYGVLARGLLGGRTPTAPTDYRAYLPRFSAEHREHNDAVVRAFVEFGQARDLTPAQLAVAWVRAKQPALVPLVGARTPAQLQDALAALERPLSADDVAALEERLGPDPLQGTRYGAEQMKHLDSER